MTAVESLPARGFPSLSPPLVTAVKQTPCCLATGAEKKGSLSIFHFNIAVSAMAAAQLRIDLIEDEPPFLHFDYSGELVPAVGAQPFVSCLRLPKLHDFFSLYVIHHHICTAEVDPSLKGLGRILKVFAGKWFHARKRADHWTDSELYGPSRQQGEDMQEISIQTDTIRLGQLLKMANLVTTGGEAKLRIQEGEVKVNGQVEMRRGRQLRVGDLVEIAGMVVKVTG
jgi:ribosome-associated protein